MRWLALMYAAAVVAGCGGSHEVASDAGPDAPTCTAPTGTLHDQMLALGDGVEDRAYWLHVPAGYACTPMPLLVDFHGTASDQPTPPEEAYQTDALIAFSDAN